MDKVIFDRDLWLAETMSLVSDWELLTDEEKKQRLYNANQEIARIIRNVAEALMPAIEYVISEIKRFWEAILQIYPNKRVVWLAQHHPKARVRKKNINRICKWLQIQYKREAKK